MVFLVSIRSGAPRQLNALLLICSIRAHYCWIYDDRKGFNYFKCQNSIVHTDSLSALDNGARSENPKFKLLTLCSILSNKFLSPKYFQASKTYLDS